MESEHAPLGKVRRLDPNLAEHDADAYSNQPDSHRWRQEFVSKKLVLRSRDPVEWFGRIGLSHAMPAHEELGSSLGD
jgi:hypothetical protein